jgi:hypothetical protein
MSGKSGKGAGDGEKVTPNAAGDFSATMTAIAAARAAGDLDEVKRLEAEVAAARAEG